MSPVIRKYIAWTQSTLTQKIMHISPIYNKFMQQNKYLHAQKEACNKGDGRK